MRRILSIVLCLIGLTGSLCAETLTDKAANGGVIGVARGDPAMAKAVADARASLPAFLAAQADPKPGTHHYAVKVGLGPVGAQEFFWIDPFVVKDDVVTGVLANDPRRVTGYERGQTINVPLSDVQDWTYRDGATMRGNYSACVLIGRAPQEEQVAFREQYGLTCPTH